MEMMAAVVDPEGRKAYWSENTLDWVENAGYKDWREPDVPLCDSVPLRIRFVYLFICTRLSHACSQQLKGLERPNSTYSYTWNFMVEIGIWERGEM